jgi:2-polyprenyl-3-methyl-5-hydroxy-6-metoxy-1,4-benzoquinol methylase
MTACTNLETTPSCVRTVIPVDSFLQPSNEVILHDGSRIDLLKLSSDELTRLQCEQEPAFAKKIASTKKNTEERTAVIRHAYETICAILDEMSRHKVAGQTLSMGMDARYTRFVLDQLLAQRKLGIEGGVFELGFGTGIFLQSAAKAGHRVGGLEVTSQLFEEAKTKVPAEYHRNLWFGDFCAIDFADQRESYSLAYWNDVFEHIPVDEISDYLKTLYSLLKPGGKLITITPNWHMRPSDVTALFKAKRSEAVGFHLKEYTLREVRQMLLDTGFSAVQTPMFISANRFYSSNTFDVTLIKSVMEPILEYLPVQVAIQICRRFGLSCTIATKPS